ncbi:hypothetical protein [Schleiferilactobacillus shenzhenensis]|uniref:Uncharacterized protein n=1 Tax=Schleiferilactobacillus shenzhenensis LY-73 TaxID=1231336 RepID=U4TQ46_9LACO|nr:hypothetical protein [Schleiferilactobacillus shenzhenensis]ERL64023.1 hypothetical protein L248_1670 [Schleiferilactobacillus shenzhenensis LY-73]
MDILTKEEIQKQVELYVAEHKKELEEKIDNKIRAAINSAIADAFGYNGWARKQVFSVIQGQVKDYVDQHGIEIDPEVIAERLRKEVERAAKRVTVRLSMKGE